RAARKLDLPNKRVTDDDGTTHTFDKLLIASGGAPRRPFSAPGVVYLRTLDDYQRLHELAERGQRIAVIGGGFIGSEIAAALAMNHKDVVMVFPEETVGARAFPRSLGLFLNQFYRESGVELHAKERITEIEQHGERFILHTAGSKKLEVDCVVAGLGIEPNVALARSADLEVENGVIVDGLLRTRHPDVYAAGDVAAFWSDALDKRVRVEHEDNAKCMGEQAGRNMAGEKSGYSHLPSFYSDLFDLGYEAVGELDSRYETVMDWSEPNRKGVVYYLEDNLVRGVLLWNVWDKVDAARQIITERGVVVSGDLIGRLVA
ncbi:MAG: NAD(P)/FAD-dependent oxidoreductase, partial [Proteobacteria bacterium]